MGEVEIAKKRSGISGNRAYRLQRRLIGALSDIYSSAISFKLTNEDIIEATQAKVLDTPDYQRVPTYVRSYLSGYLEAKRDELYHYHLVWVLSVDGRLMSSKEVDQLTQEEQVELHTTFLKRCGKPGDGSFRHPPNMEEFLHKFLPNDYKSPWARVNGTKSRHVWKDIQTGEPIYDKPFNRKWVCQHAWLPYSNDVCICSYCGFLKGLTGERQ